MNEKNIGKNRFEEDIETPDEGDTSNTLLFDDDDLNSILAQDSDDEDYEDAHAQKAEAKFNEEIAILYQEDHGLTYAVVYAYLFLIAEEEAKAPTNDNWRLSFNCLLPSDSLIRFYKTRRDSPQFVRARIKAVLETLEWSETAPKQSEEVLMKYVTIEMAARVFITSLHSKNLLADFIEHCKTNYSRLAELTKGLDRDSIARGINADIFTGVTEAKYVESPLGAANQTQTVQWVASEIQECAKGKDNHRFLDRLYSNRFKDRLEVDEAIFADLEQRFPHFIEVITYYKAQFRLNLLTGRDYIPPTLLLGSPGIGKTVFAKELAKALHTGYTFGPVRNSVCGARIRS